MVESARECPGGGEAVMNGPRSGMQYERRNWSYQLLPNPDARGDESRVALLDGRLAGAAPVGERGADDQPGGTVGVDVPEHVRGGDHGEGDLPGREGVELERHE